MKEVDLLMKLEAIQSNCEWINEQFTPKFMQPSKSLCNPSVPVKYEFHVTWNDLEHTFYNLIWQWHFRTCFHITQSCL